MNKKQKRHLGEGDPYVTEMTKHGHLGLSLKGFHVVWIVLNTSFSFFNYYF